MIASLRDLSTYDVPADPQHLTVVAVRLVELVEVGLPGPRRPGVGRRLS